MHAAEYLQWFEERGYSVSLISPTVDPPLAFPDVGSLVAQWGDPLRIENLLLRPHPNGRA